MDFILPARILVIGKSCTGKTYLVSKMIMNRSFGPLRELEIFVYSPEKRAAEQHIWKDLRAKGFDIKNIILDKRTVSPGYKRTKNRLIIFDDIDRKKSLPDWIVEKFTIESHHANENVIMISHKLKIGLTELRNSADWVIVTENKPNVLRTICDESDISFDAIDKLLSDPRGLILQENNTKKSFNHVVIVPLLYDVYDQKLPRLYRIANVDEELDLIVLD